MGNGALWIWMTLSLHVVHLSPVLIDIDPGQDTDTSPEYVLKFGSEDFLHPGQSSGFETGRKTQDM